MPHTKVKATTRRDAAAGKAVRRGRVVKTKRDGVVTLRSGDNKELQIPLEAGDMSINMGNLEQATRNASKAMQDLGKSMTSLSTSIPTEDVYKVIQAAKDGLVLSASAHQRKKQRQCPHDWVRNESRATWKCRSCQVEVADVALIAMKEILGGKPDPFDGAVEPKPWERFGPLDGMRVQMSNHMLPRDCAMIEGHPNTLFMGPEVYAEYLRHVRT